MSCRGICNPGTCVQCDRVEKNPIPQQRVDEFFNGLREALEAAGKLKKPNPLEAPDPTFDWFLTRCVERLRQGAETYGNTFLTDRRDLVDEALEEQMDTANYVLMELLKHSPDDTDAACLGSAAAHSFYVVQDLLHYKAKLRGAP